MIGIFDSGFGGLSVLREIKRELPNYRYVYLGDTAHAPYGPRTREEIYQFTLEAVQFLFGKGCELVVLACNTASAEALRKIQQEYLPIHHPNCRVLGVIVPAAEEAISRTRNNRVGVMATEGTVRSNAFVHELKKLRPDVEVFQQACPLLVPLIESGEHESEASRRAVEGYLKPLLEAGIDTLVLGCTHYEHVLPHIHEVLGGGVGVVSEGEVIAHKLKEYLSRHSEFEKRVERSSSLTFYTTDTTDQFKNHGAAFFGQPIEPIHVTSLASA